MSNWSKIKHLSKQYSTDNRRKRPLNDAQELIDTHIKSINSSTTPLTSETISSSDTIEQIESSSLEFEKKSSLSILDKILNSSSLESMDKTIMDDYSTDIKVSDAARQKIGKYLAIDCEMVGVGPNGYESALARVSIVNFHGHTLMDEYVRPREYVTDYRTDVSGITKEHLLKAHDFELIQTKVSNLIQDKVVVGHGLENDFKVLLMNHPRNSIRDTSNYPVFRKLNSGKKPSLKLLASSILGMEIQESSHCSVTDASIAMLLYKRHRDDWEKSLNMCQKDKSDAQDKSVEKAPLLAQNSNAIRKKRQKMSRKRINKNKLVL